MIKDVLYPLSVNEGLDSTQHEPLLLRQHVHILNAVLQMLSWPEEEGTLTLWDEERKKRKKESVHVDIKYFNCPVLQAEEWFIHLHHSLLSKLRFSISPHGVQNHTVLPAVQSRHINHPDNLLCNRGYVSFSVCHSHQPLFSSAAFSAPSVTERPESSHMQSFLMKEEMTSRRW